MLKDEYIHIILKLHKSFLIDTTGKIRFMLSVWGGGEGE